MMDEKSTQAIDLKHYQPFGIPIIKLMSSIALLALIATALYEYYL